MNRPGARQFEPWLWIGVGLLLAAIPSLVAVMRLLQWGNLNSTPLPVASGSLLEAVLGLHVISVLAFGLLVPFQISPISRRKPSGLHKRQGKLLWGMGVLAALTGLVLSLLYPHGTDDGVALLVARLAAGTWMLWSLGHGLMAIKQHRIGEHRAWMIRAYAVGMGAGTQVLTHLPILMWPGIEGEAARTLCMVAGWLINISVAECVINVRRT